MLCKSTIMSGYVLPDRTDPRLAPLVQKGLAPPACNLLLSSAVTLRIGLDRKLAAVLPDKRPISIRTLIKIAEMLHIESNYEIDEVMMTTVCRIDEQDGGREWHKMILCAPAEDEFPHEFPNTFEVCHVIPKGHTWAEFTNYMRNIS